MSRPYRFDWAAGDLLFFGGLSCLPRKTMIGIPETPQ